MWEYSNCIECNRKKRYFGAARKAYERTLDLVGKIIPVDHIRHLEISLALARFVRRGAPHPAEARKILAGAISRAREDGPDHNDGHNHSGTHIIDSAEAQMKEWCVQDLA